MYRRLTVAACCALLLGGTILVAWAADEPKPQASESSKLLGHNIFFALNEPSDANKSKLIEACKTHLSQHSGLVFFAVGTRDEAINGAFNDKNFDVALHMVFTGKEALGVYARTPDHQKFIAEATPLLKGIRIFDSTVESVKNKAETAAR